jgi:ABC-type uncharacterized transport system permease subunit
VRGFLVILLYLLGAAAALHAARRATARAVLQEPALYLALAALLAHALWLVDALAPLGEVTLSLAESGSLMGLAIGAGGALALLAPRFRGIAAIVLVIAALLAVGTGSLPEPREIAAPGWPFAVHVILAMAAAGLFTIAAVFVVLLALQDASLRGRRPHGWLATLPPIESLERALFSVISIGMAALSIAILAGLLFVTDLFEQHLVHKTVLALAAWFIFAVLLFGRWRFGWRGRTALYWTLGSFTLLGLAYFGSKVVLEFILERHWG